MRGVREAAHAQGRFCALLGDKDSTQTDAALRSLEVGTQWRKLFDLTSQAVKGRGGGAAPGRPAASAMRRIFGLSSKGPAPSGPAGLPGSCRGARYRVRDRAVGKLHKAASGGDAAKVQHLLILGKCGVNDRDKKHR